MAGIKLSSLLLEKKSAILEKWFDLILETYPQDTSKFLMSQKNRFANPVGHAISQGIEGIFNELIKDEPDSAQVTVFLDNIIRIRAIQDFTPSQALAFIFLLKEVVRQEFKDLSPDPQEMSVFEFRVDKLALVSFDIYMGCREKLYEVRTNEFKNRAYRLLERANMLVGAEDEDPKDGSI